MIMRKNYLKHGLVPCGKNEDGEMEYIGTREQWAKTEITDETPDEEKVKVKTPAVCEMYENEVDELMDK